MTKEIQNPDDHSDRVNDVVSRAAALSDELRTTITELSQILRDQPKETNGVRQPVH